VVQNSYLIYRTTQISFKRYTYLQILRQGISPETELASEPNPEFAALASSGTEPGVSKAARGGGWWCNSSEIAHLHQHAEFVLHGEGRGTELRQHPLPSSVVQCFHYIIRPAFWDHAAVEWDDEN
jgi:hypothetical protein